MKGWIKKAGFIYSGLLRTLNSVIKSESDFTLNQLNKFKSILSNLYIIYLIIMLQDLKHSFCHFINKKVEGNWGKLLVEEHRVRVDLNISNYSLWVCDCEFHVSIQQIWQETEIIINIE